MSNHRVNADGVIVAKGVYKLFQIGKCFIKSSFTNGRLSLTLQLQSQP